MKSLRSWISWLFVRGGFVTCTFKHILAHRMDRLNRSSKPQTHAQQAWAKTACVLPVHDLINLTQAPCVLKPITADQQNRVHHLNEHRAATPLPVSFFESRN
jgi:hypothetical protein